MAGSLVGDRIGGTRGDAERRARRFATRELRPRRTMVALTTALGVTGIAGAAAVELLAVALGTGLHPVPGAEENLSRLRTLPWGDPRVRAAAGGMVLAGLVLLAAALPGRTRGVPLAGADPCLAGVLRRRDLRRTLADAARGVPGIVRVRVWGPWPGVGMVVVASTRFRNRANIAELVRGAVEVRLRRAAPLVPPPVTVRLTCRRD
ncbi:DUF6286 domain-containing protein [Spirillospora albida]|uniref:DUF6286 domain-containing protein n=1 Tax=Spirillospora albida TaxID=58123 RepID=UPI0004BF70DE|nr:DUF6286 domain-containing protein [Spirillospora albida]